MTVPATDAAILARGENAAVRPGPVFPAAPWTLALLMALAALWIYWPALHGGWLWDDDTEIVGNPDLRSFAGLVHIWTSPLQSDYWPVTWTLLWLEWHLWGAHVLGYHLVSVALHVCSGLLLWRLLDRLGLRWGWLGGFLFVIHPLGVESVAWMSEIKNTLSLPLLLLAFDAWLTFDATRRHAAWLRSIGLFGVAMLAKSSVVMLPFVLLLHGGWKRDEIGWRKVLRVAPYVLIAALLGLGTIYVQRGRFSAMSGPSDSLVATVTCAGKIVLFYLGKFVFPVGLLPVYPVWHPEELPWQQIIAVPLLAFLFLLLWLERKSWSRGALFGLGFFVLNLVPVMGFFKMSYQTLTPVADHLTYLPSAGLAGLAAAGAEMLYRRARGVLGPLLLGGLAVLAAILIGLTHAYAGWFVDQETLWTRTLERNPRAAPGYLALGIVRADQQDLNAAVPYFRQAQALAPQHDGIYASLGHALLLQGHLDEAQTQLDRATAINPQRSGPFLDRGTLGLATGRPDEVESNLREFCRLAPNDDNIPYAHLWLWIGAEESNREPDARAELNAILNATGQPESWSRQIADYEAGSINQAELLAAAPDADPVADRHHRCEAWYYLGIKALLSGDRNTASVDFQRCTALDCRDMVETILAAAELKRLAPPQP